jgi:hypothetical protein
MTFSTAAPLKATSNSSNITIAVPQFCHELAPQAGKCHSWRSMEQRYCPIKDTTFLIPPPVNLGSYGRPHCKGHRIKSVVISLLWKYQRMKRGISYRQGGGESEWPWEDKWDAPYCSQTRNNSTMPEVADADHFRQTGDNKATDYHETLSECVKWIRTARYMAKYRTILSIFWAL